MADNVPISAGVGTSIATDQIGLDHYQINKLAFGVLDTATLVSPANPFPIGNSANASGTLSASDAVVGAPVGDGTLVVGASTAGSIVAIVVPNGAIAWTMLLKNYSSGTIYTEASSNSTNGTDGDWVEVKGRRTGTAPGTESVVYAMVASGYYRGNCAGFTYLRARLIGGVGATIRFDLSSGMGATFLNSGIPAGTSSIGKVAIDQTTPGSTNLVSLGVGLAAGGAAGSELTVDRLKVNAELKMLDTAQPVGSQIVAAKGDQINGLLVNVRSTGELPEFYYLNAILTELKVISTMLQVGLSVSDDPSTLRDDYSNQAN